MLKQMKIKNIDAGYIALVALLVLTAIFSMNLFFSERASHDRVDINIFPHKVGPWTGEDLKIGESDYKILQTRNLISRRYTSAAGGHLYLFIIYSETNRAVFHPPEVCMLGSGATITDKQVEKIGSGKRVFSVNKLFAGKDNARDMILYCYKAGDLYTGNFYLQQAYLALHQVFARRVPGATIRVSTGIKGDEKAALATLKDFLIRTVDIVNSLS